MGGVEIIAVAVMYIDRLVRMNPTFIVTEANVNRLLVSALLISYKYNQDDYYSNSWLARIFCLTVEEINRMEITFLKMINFRAHVDADEVFQISHWLMQLQV